MSKIKLTGSNSGYVEIDSAADAGNLTLTLPTSGVRLLSNTDNVFSGITTTGELDINGKIDVSTDAVIARNLSVGGITTHTGTTTLSDDVTFTGGSYNVVWDKSDNQLEFGDNAKISFGGQADMRLFHDGTNSVITNATGDLYINNNADTIIKPANDLFLKPQDGENGISVIGNGAVELYFNNSKKVETTNTGAVVTGICTATSFSGDGSGLSNTSHRRLNYNGAMLVNQRGNASTGSFSYYYGPDRYYSQGNGNNNGNWNIAQAADVPDGYGFKYSLEYGCTATSSHADRYLMTVYRMEGNDSQVFNYGTANAKTITLSFWIKCSKAGNFQVNFENEQNPDAGYQVQQTINSAGQWEKKVVTIPGDTTKAFSFGTQKAMCFDIVYSAYGSYASGTPSAAWSALANEQRGGHCNMDLFDSTSNYVKITGVQLEIGSTATEFEHIPYADELARCQRYYEGIYMGTGTAIFRTYLNNAGGGSNVSNVEYNYKVEKRGTPTWSLEGNATWYPSGTSGMSAYPSTSTCLFQRNDSTAQFLTDANGDLCGSFSCEI